MTQEHTIHQLVKLSTFVTKHSAAVHPLFPRPVMDLWSVTKGTETADFTDVLEKYNKKKKKERNIKRPVWAAVRVDKATTDLKCQKHHAH